MMDGFHEGSTVFVRSPAQAWIAAKIISPGPGEGQFTVSMGDGGMLKKQTVKEADLVLADETHVMPNLASIAALKAPVTEAAVLDLVRRRAMAGHFYTQAPADMLVSVNLWSEAAGGEQKSNNNKNSVFGSPLQFLSLPSDIEEHDEMMCKPQDMRSPPHLFKLANRALRQLFRHIAHAPSVPQTQSILLYGEEGSGKSFSARKILSFLLAVDAKVSEGHPHSTATVINEAMIDHAEIITQSFGCVGTSTRFVAQTVATYNEDHVLQTVSFVPHLLERARLFPHGVSGQHNNNKSSFNVFYQLLAGAPSDLLQALHLPNVYLDALATIPLLSSSSSHPGSAQPAHKANYTSLCEALTSPSGCALSSDQVTNVWNSVAAVLHLSSIMVSAEDASISFSSGCSAADIEHLLSMSEGSLVQFLTAPFKKDHERFQAPLFKARCLGLASTVYEAVFNFLLSHVCGGGATAATATTAVAAGVHSLSILEVSTTSYTAGTADALLLNALSDSVAREYSHKLLPESHQSSAVGEPLHASLLAAIESTAAKTVGDEPYLITVLGAGKEYPAITTHASFSVAAAGDAFEVKNMVAAGNSKSSGAAVSYSIVGMLGAFNVEVTTPPASLLLLPAFPLAAPTPATTRFRATEDLLKQVFSFSSSDQPLIVHHLRKDEAGKQLLEELCRPGTDMVSLCEERSKGFPIVIPMTEFMHKFEGIVAGGGTVEEILASVGAHEGSWVLQGSSSSSSSSAIRLKDDGTVEALVMAAHEHHEAASSHHPHGGVGAAKIQALRVMESLGFKSPAKPAVRRTAKDESAEKIQRFVRRTQSKVRVQTLHQAVSQGDMVRVRSMLSQNPSDIRTVDKTQEYCTLQHTALRSGSLPMLQLLGLRPIDVLIKDAGEHTSAHYAALKPNVRALQLLYKCLSQVHVHTPGGTPESIAAQETASPAAPTQGWMMKLSGTTGGQWLRRYFVVDDRGVSYFHDEAAAKHSKPKDTYPLSKQQSIYSRAMFVDNTIIITTNQKSYVKGRTLVVLRALGHGETTTQEWLLALSRISSIMPFREGFARLRNPELCRLWLNELTWAEESALHTLARGGGSGGSTDQVAVAAWLVDHGVPVNLANHDGQTALHLAIFNNNETLAFCLFKKGASLSVKDKAGKTPLDYASFVLTRLLQSSGTDTVRHLELSHPTLPAPVKIFGYTYVTLFFQRQTLGVYAKTGKTLATKHPYLTVSLMRGDRELVEQTQEIVSSVHSTENEIWWGHTVHLQVRCVHRFLLPLSLSSSHGRSDF